jgi:endonuclease YncB( thermonuclease family)
LVMRAAVTMLVGIWGVAAAGGPEYPLRTFCTAYGAVASDNFTVRCGLVRRTIRLDNIDGPESGQFYGNTAQALLHGALADTPMTLTVHGEDDGIWHGTAQLEDGSDLGARLVEMGFAWAAPRAADPDLPALQAQARRARRGLWAFADPVVPWEWRRTHPAPADATPRADAAAAELERRAQESEAAYRERMRSLLTRLCSIGRIEDAPDCVKRVDARFPLPPPSPQ